MKRLLRRVWRWFRKPFPPYEVAPAYEEFNYVEFRLTDRDLAEMEPKDEDIPAKWCERCKRIHPAHNPKKDRDEMLAAAGKHLAAEVDAEILRDFGQRECE